MDYVNHSEIFALVARHCEREFFRERRTAESSLRLPHRLDFPGEHHLEGVFRQTGFKGIDDADKFLVSRVVGVAHRIVRIQ